MWRLSAAALVVMSFLMVSCGLGSARDDGRPAGDGIAADDNAGGDDGDEDKGRPGGGRGGLEVTVFARDLILHHTANNTLPVTTEDKHLIDVNPITFRPRFFR